MLLSSFTNNVGYPEANSGPRLPKMQLRELELKREEEKRQFKISFFKDQKLLFGGYFALVFINIFTLVKFNKNKFLIFTH